MRICARRHLPSVLLSAAVFFAGVSRARALDYAYTVLHNFTSTTTDGGRPLGDLTLFNDTLYGATAYGGAASKGEVFKINKIGTGFNLVRSFTGAPSEPSPGVTLTLSNATFYSASAAGGANNQGTVYKVNPDGTGFGLLHSFSNSAQDSLGPVLVSGSTIFGQTQLGGSAGTGTLYKMDATGSNFSLMHSFTGAPGDGRWANGGLVQSGQALYGVTEFGGSVDFGTIYSINTDGTNYHIIHSFISGEGDSPHSAPILIGNTLYGLTFGGGVGAAQGLSAGTVYRIDTDGNNFQTLHNFVPSLNQGQYPMGSLIMVGSSLFGMTSQTGINGGGGTIFRIDPDGGNFQVLHTFQGNDGVMPFGSLIESDGTFYGMTFAGGTGGEGTIFRLTPEPATLALLTLGTLSLLSRRRPHTRRA